MGYECRPATENDIDLLTKLDKHITPSELINSVKFGIWQGIDLNSIGRERTVLL